MRCPVDVGSDARWDYTAGIFVKKAFAKGSTRAQGDGSQPNPGKVSWKGVPASGTSFEVRRGSVQPLTGSALRGPTLPFQALLALGLVPGRTRAIHVAPDLGWAGAWAQWMVISQVPPSAVIL